MLSISRIAKNVLADRRYVYMYAQRALVDYRERRFFAKLEALLAAGKIQTTPRSERMAGQLRDRGYCEPFQMLSAHQARSLREEIERLPLVDPYRPKYGEFTAENIPAESHIAEVRSQDTARAPGVMALANHPDVLGAAALAFGCAPTLDYIVAWWSVPGHDRPEEAQSFHRDFDGLNFLKVFIHLSDVDDDCGPHIYVAGSHRQNIPDESIRRRRDEDITAFYGAERIVRFTGVAGTAFIENTYGFHKGEVPKSKRRLMLQFVYSVMPTTLGPKKPFLQPSEMPAGYDRRINRRFAL